jgi:hypothetical protein
MASAMLSSCNVSLTKYVVIVKVILAFETSKSLANVLRAGKYMLAVTGEKNDAIAAKTTIHLFCLFVYIENGSLVGAASDSIVVLIGSLACFSISSAC